MKATSKHTHQNKNSIQDYWIAREGGEKSNFVTAVAKTLYLTLLKLEDGEKN